VDRDTNEIIRPASLVGLIGLDTEPYGGEQRRRRVRLPWVMTQAGAIPALLFF
jgi:hypothetical protein